MSFYIAIKLFYIFLSISIYRKFSGPKVKRHPHDIFNSNHKVFVECHRGVNREIDENTLNSFQKAIDYNIGSIEIDVFLTKDNEMVIHHGDGTFGSIDQLFDHVGDVTNLSWKELSSYRTKRSNLKMPTLRETFKLAKNKLFINLEFKDPRIDLTFSSVMKLIEEYDFFDQISLSSFYHEYYDRVIEYNKNNNRNLVFGFLYQKYGDFNFNRNGSSLNIYWTDATKELCDTAHKNGMPVLVWFEMFEEENNKIYRQLIENGVDIICSNEPLLAKKYIKYYYFNNKNKRYK